VPEAVISIDPFALPKQVTFDEDDIKTAGSAFTVKVILVPFDSRPVMNSLRIQWRCKCPLSHSLPTEEYLSQELS